MSGGSEPIADHEILYRRIPAASGFYDPHVDPNPSPLAFRPTQLDTTGLSLSRAKYKSLEQAGQGREGKQYYVAVLRAGELRRLGIEIVPRPLPDDPGHCEIADLTFANRKSIGHVAVFTNPVRSFPDLSPIFSFHSALDTGRRSFQ